MPTMILVEDETFERNSLKNCIDWKLIGVQIIGEAVNGSQGLSLVMEAHPDIVLTDVKMPVMDGIELSRRIRSVAPETKIIFLSSYDDFEYAKQAIDLNINAYIMKPVNEAELLRVVKKAADEVTEKALEQRLYNKIKNNYTISVNLARQALVNRVLTGMQVNEEDARNLGLEWLCYDSGNMCLILSFYNKDLIKNIDESLIFLNRSCSKVCSQSINVCIIAGILVTLCYFSDEAENKSMAEVEQIIREFFEKNGDKNVRIESMSGNEKYKNPSELYAAILQRNVIGYIEPPAVIDKKKNKKQIADEVEEIIKSQYQSPLSLDTIAKMVNFTPNYIGTIFKSVKKISVNRYLMKVRLENAEELLKNSRLTINEIAEQCGFGSITYFHTIFKKEKGMTPNEYRQCISG